MLTVLVLAGCTPEDGPKLGLTVRDGKPVVLYFACGGLSTISLVATTGQAPSTPGGEALWEVLGDGTEGLAELPLFGTPPAGWELKVPAAGELEPGSGYVLTGYPRTISVRFSTEQVAKLKEGQVLTRDSFKGAERTVSRGEFVDEAGGYC
jgi:hypothetical protein